MTNPICLVTAVDIEFKTAITLLSQSVLLTESKYKICRGVIGDRRITVLQCGMGARGFAEWLSHHLKNNSYEALIVAGLAGGLNPKLKTGDAVVYDLCVDSVGKSAKLRCDERLVGSLFEALQSASLRSFRGAGVTVSRIITESTDKLRLGEHHQALAVDMESFDVLRVAAEFGLPAAVVRVISDEAGHDLPDFNSTYDPDGGKNYRRLAAAMTRRPAASFRFLLSLKRVIQSLRKSLEVVLRV